MLLSPQPSDKSSGPPPALLSSPLIPERLGRYRVHERLAVGGMAEIFLGESIGAGGFRKLVVLKRILPQLARDQRYIRMFLDEGRLAARMSHPGIPLVFDAGVEDGDHFLAMEYVHGQNLHQVLRRMSERGLALDLRAAANLVAQVSAALNYAHGLRDEGGRPLGLVHRDVSPSNIIISYDGNAKLIDFGIAKSLTQSVRTQHGALKGKYSYMAPEQVRGEPLDGRADVFALGSVLYQLVTGRRPFPGQQFTALSSIEAGCYQPPRAFRADLPPDLEAVITRALEHDRNDRFQTAEAFRIALIAAVPGLETHSLARLMAELFPGEAHGWREESDREATLSISATPETAAPPPAAPGLGSLPDPICDFRGEKPPATPFPPPARPRWRMRLALPASLSLAVACAAYALSTRDAGRAVANPMPRVERAAPASPTPETFEPTPETAAPLAVAAAPVTVDETSPADDLPAPRPQDGTATAPPDAEIEEQPAQSDDAIDDDIDIDLADLRKVSP